MKKKRLIIFTKKFGFNFTGATLATHELLKYWSRNFSEITVITKEVGKYEENEKLEVLVESSTIGILTLLFKTKDSDAVYYSDDHLGYLLKLCGIRYFHTYHGNWPDASKVNLEFWIKSIFFIPAYTLALKNANLVINVSYYMEKYTRKFNRNTVVIRNGLGQKSENHLVADIQVIKSIRPKSEKLKIVMVGGVDRRKYYLANKLFNLINSTGLNNNITVDIYGGIHDKKVGDMLERYNFVKMKGHRDKIGLEKYDLLLNTSKIENLSISVCEALANKVPVMCFNVGGLGEVVKNARNGFLIPVKDIQGMVSKMDLIIKNGFGFHFYENSFLEYDWEFAANEYIKQFTIETNR